jgi:hypothetical protein
MNLKGKFQMIATRAHTHRLLLSGARFILAAALMAFSSNAWALDAPDTFVEYMGNLTTGRVGIPLKLKKGESAATKASFKPPVEILIEAKTHTTNLRIGYAARQVIFNWEHIGDELRIDGGPAGGKHKGGAGAIPRDKYVLIRWLVTPTKQSIFVDGQLRYEHEGDYSTIDSPVSVFGAEGSEVTVKSIKVKKLPPDTQ